jgi:hypothetical protein
MISDGLTSAPPQPGYSADAQLQEAAIFVTFCDLNFLCIQHSVVVRSQSAIRGGFISRLQPANRITNLTGGTHDTA